MTAQQPQPTMVHTPSLQTLSISPSLQARTGRLMGRLTCLEETGRRRGSRTQEQSFQDLQATGPDQVHWQRVVGLSQVHSGPSVWMGPIRVLPLSVQLAVPT